MLPELQSVKSINEPRENRLDVQFDVAGLAQQLLHEGSNNVYREVGSTVDRILLRMVMQHVNGNQQHAAELLGISRMTLRSKLRAIEAEEQASRRGDENGTTPSPDSTSTPDESEPGLSATNG